MPITASSRMCTSHRLRQRDVYLKLTVIDDLLIVSFKEL